MKIEDFFFIFTQKLKYEFWKNMVGATVASIFKQY